MLWSTKNDIQFGQQFAFSLEHFFYCHNATYREADTGTS